VLRAVVFDLDGTIIDTETPEFVSWQEAYAAHGAVLDRAVWAQAIGTTDSGFDPCAHLERLIGAPVDRPALRAARRARFDELMSDARPRDGVLAWLDEARDLGLRTGVASSSRAPWVTRFLDALSLRDRFDTLATRDRVTRSKPDPELYELALSDLAVPAAQALAVEDSPNGVAAAKAAGLFCVAVPNLLTAALPLTAADVVLPSLAARTLSATAAGRFGPATGPRQSR
jgi:HAD superfamily hydrolase (TIGR01509 family)